jgi:hypothetical protein
MLPSCNRAFIHFGLTHTNRSNEATAMTATATRPIKILLQTTIPHNDNDWNIARRPFNIAVAFESHDGAGRGWAESTFHHFTDYNWDTSLGRPSFVTEHPSDAIARDPSLRGRRPR